MASQTTRNIVGVVCLACVLLGVFVVWTPHATTRISADTLVYSEHYDGDVPASSQTNVKQVRKLWQ